jgi:hypothetical protein
VDPGETLDNYNAIGFVFMPRLEQVLASHTPTDFLRRAGAFIERACDSGDIEAVNVMYVEIFESLLPYREKLRLLWPHLGEKANAAIRDSASRWDAVPDRDRTPHMRGKQWSDNLPD